MPDERCGYEKDDGEQCRSHIGLCDECGHCIAHCPHREETAQQARSKGGKRKAEKARDSKYRTVSDDQAPPPPESLEDAVHWASWATWAVATGQIDGKTAHEVGYLLRAYMKSLDKVELGDRVEELEEKIARLRREGIEAVQ